jgi:serine protease Do
MKVSFRSLKNVIAIILLVVYLLQFGNVSARPDFNRKTPVVIAAEKAGPAVVNIYTEEISSSNRNPFRGMRDNPFENFFKDLLPRRSNKRQSLGSGVIIDPRGYVITNQHVVDKASRIKVILSDGRTFKARLIGADIKSDLTIIKIDTDNSLPHIKMGGSDDLMIGETVLAIGNPFGLRHTVTQGIISALNRTIRSGKNVVYNDFIQVDASINPGNSGGPLLNINGDLIGINAAIYQKAKGIGFAIPIDHAKRIVNDLIQFGKVRRGWLGVTVQDMTESLYQYFKLDRPIGVLSVKVFRESPAGRAGLKKGDLILSVDNHEVRNKSDYEQTMSSYTIDDFLSLGIIQGHKKRTLRMRVSSIPKAYAPDFTLHWLGIRVQDISQASINRFQLSTRKGVVVVYLDPKGASRKTGIRSGDVIRQINQANIRNEKDFNDAIVEAGKRSSILLLVQRGTGGYYVTLEP